MSIEWNENLASGYPEIDTQHKELFERINTPALYGLSKRNTDRQEISTIIQYLSDYVVFHFGNEEKFMNQFSYSSKTAHLAQHEQFVKSFGKAEGQDNDGRNQSWRRPRIQSSYV